MGFALGEALAHLNFLMHQGALDRELGADGVYRFIRTAVTRRSEPSDTIKRTGEVMNETT